MQTVAQLAPKNNLFIPIFTVYRLHLMFGSEALGAVAGGEGLHRASRREGRHCSRGRNVGRASRGRAKGVLGTGGILVDKVRDQLSGDELVG